MKNITLSIDEDLLNQGREYAQAHHMSFNHLVRQLIQQTVKKTDAQWLEDTFDYMDKNLESAQGITWSREDLYRG